MKETTCPYAKSCHFYSIEQVTRNTEVLRDIYCFGEPRTCEIYRRRSSYRTVSITQWPDGSLRAMSLSDQNR